MSSAGWVWLMRGRRFLWGLPLAPSLTFFKLGVSLFKCDVGHVPVPVLSNKLSVFACQFIQDNGHFTIEVKLPVWGIHGPSFNLLLPSFYSVVESAVTPFTYQLFIAFRCRQPTANASGSASTREDVKEGSFVCGYLVFLEVSDNIFRPVFRNLPKLFLYLLSPKTDQQDSYLLRGRIGDKADYPHAVLVDSYKEVIPERGKIKGFTENPRVDIVFFYFQNSSTETCPTWRPLKEHLALDVNECVGPRGKSIRSEREKAEQVPSLRLRRDAKEAIRSYSKFERDMSPLFEASLASAEEPFRSLVSEEGVKLRERHFKVKRNPSDGTHLSGIVKLTPSLILFTYNTLGEKAKIVGPNRASFVSLGVNPEGVHEGGNFKKFAMCFYDLPESLVFLRFTPTHHLIRYLHSKKYRSTLNNMRHGKILRPKDVAEMLGITPGGVRMMVYRGQLPARRLGRRIVFLEEELKEALKKLPRVVPAKT